MSLDIKQSCATSLFDALSVVVVIRESTNSNICSRYGLHVERTFEVTISLVDETIHDKHLVCVGPNVATLGSKLSSVPRWVLDLKTSLWIPLKDIDAFWHVFQFSE